MSPGPIPLSAMPWRLSPSTKSKRRASWRRKSGDIKGLQKCGGFVVVPKQTRGSDQESREDQSWSLDLEVSTEDEPLVHQIVLSPRISMENPFVNSVTDTPVHPPALSQKLPTSLLPDSPRDYLPTAPQDLPLELRPAPPLGFGPEIGQENALSLYARPAPVGRTSVPLPVPPPPPPPPERAHYRCIRCENIVKIQRELAQRRKEMLTARTHVQSEQASLARLRNFEFKTREDAIQAVKSALERNSLKDDISRITELQQRSAAACLDLSEGEKTFNKVQGQLSSIEYLFGKKEGEFFNLVSHRHIDDGSLESDALASALQETDSAGQTESDSLPSLLEEYYDKAGDVNLEWDRLQELEADHQIQLRLREQDTEEGRYVMPSQETFMRDFFEERASIIRRLLQAKTDARGLRRQCEEHNYSIQDDSSNKALENYNFESFGHQGSDRLLSLLLIGEVNHGQRMQEWLKGNIHKRNALTTTTHRIPLWEYRTAYSEIGPQAEPEAPVQQAQTEAGLELRLEQMVDTSTEETDENGEHRAYPQTWPDLTRVQSGLSGTSASGTMAWRPEVSLQHRYSSPELRQIARSLSA